MDINKPRIIQKHFPKGFPTYKVAQRIITKLRKNNYKCCARYTKLRRYYKNAHITHGIKKRIDFSLFLQRMNDMVKIFFNPILNISYNVICHNSRCAGVDNSQVTSLTIITKINILMIQFLILKNCTIFLYFQNVTEILRLFIFLNLF